MRIKSKRKKFILLIFLAIFCILGLSVFFINIQLQNKLDSLRVETDENTLIFYLAKSNSYGSDWSYEMSSDNVLKEKESDILNYVYGEFNYWKFEPIGEGEVTICFTAYYELEVLQESCFTVTYYVDENLNITEISNENKPEKVNFEGAEENLLILEIYNYLYRQILKLIP